MFGRQCHLDVGADSRARGQTIELLKGLLPSFSRGGCGQSNRGEAEVRCCSAPRRRESSVEENPPGELPIDPVADERLVRVTAWVGAS